MVSRGFGGRPRLFGAEYTHSVPRIKHLSHLGCPPLQRAFFFRQLSHACFALEMEELPEALEIARLLTFLFWAAMVASVVGGGGGG
ncbi:hypothetical protein GGH99_006401, partial [Coemansia sp. RSA 1285]